MIQSNTEGRIVRLETWLRSIQAAFRSLTGRVQALEGIVRQLSGVQYNWGGGGGSGAIYKCVVPSGGPFVATGTQPSTTPDSFTADIYSLDGTPTLVVADATVYYDGAVDLASGSTVIVKRNTDGSYSVINVVCPGA